jgi:hypothetical protein
MGEVIDIAKTKKERLEVGPKPKWDFMFDTMESHTMTGTQLSLYSRIFLKQQRTKM